MGDKSRLKNIHSEYQNLVCGELKEAEGRGRFGVPFFFSIFGVALAQN